MRQALLTILAVTLMSAAHADVVIETDNGFAFNVPDGWVVRAMPEGFNTAPFDEYNNPFGIRDGVYPVYQLYLSQLGCLNEDGTLRLYPPPVCPEVPTFVPTQTCYVGSNNGSSGNADGNSDDGNAGGNQGDDGDGNQNQDGTDVDGNQDGILNGGQNGQGGADPVDCVATPCDRRCYVASSPPPTYCTDLYP